MAENFPKGLKTPRENEKLLVTKKILFPTEFSKDSSRAISPFPVDFSNDLYCRHVKARACLGKDQQLVFKDYFNIKKGYYFFLYLSCKR